MEQLDADQQEQLKKSSTERLRLKLVKAGVDEEKVMSMDRPKLLEAVAHSVIGSATGSGEIESEVKLKELALEEIKLRLQMEEREREAIRREKREAEERKEKLEEMLRREKREELELRLRYEAEEKEREARRKQEEREWEYKIKIEQQERLDRLKALRPGYEGEYAESGDAENRDEVGQRWNDTLAGRTKRYGETLKHVLPLMPKEIAELPQFFDTVEKLYSMYEVPADLQAKLLIPLLTARAKSVICRMPATDMENYEALKEFLLAEFKLTPREYKVRFDSAVKGADETYVLFAARLRNLLMYYLRSRNVDQDYQKLCDLLVSDRLKSCLPSGPLNYVLSLEGNDWYTPDKVASLSDTFVNNHQHQSTMRGRESIRGSYSASNGRVNAVSGHRPVEPWISSRGGGQTPVKRCYRCNSFAHLARACPRGRGRGINRDGTNTAQVSFCSTLKSRTTFDECVISKPESWEFAEYPAFEGVNINNVKLSPLQFMDIELGGIACTALCDSGAQVPVISRRLFDKCQGDIIGSVCLQGVIGESVNAPLVGMSVKCSGRPDQQNIAPDLPIVCAVADINATDYDVVLPADVVSEVRKLPNLCVTKSNVNAVHVDTNQTVSKNVDSSDEQTINSHVDNVDDISSGGFGDASSLIKEQEEDITLKSCWDFAQKGKNGFRVHCGILFHNDKVEGQPVSQLCVPHGRRSSVLKLAHDSVFGGHMGERKTRERIRLSFYWPELRQSVHEYVASCSECQLRSRVMTKDRVPITPVTRADIPFQVLNMDCIGPLDPPSAQGHRYCLCIVDNCTRWPAVYMLKSLTARSVCEALLDLFANVGVPNVIISDCGTNFTSQLTREMLSRLGCSPRFNTPGHPEASGLVERFNQTCKNMLSHVVHKHQRQWHKFVPMMVWALREVPNATTGISPYMLVYGRIPRGPLSILKESWTGERDITADLSQPVEDYLTDLKAKLESAADFAKQHSKHEQEQYVSRYNLRSQDKNFDVGDHVIVLAPENKGKLCNRWQGPGTVIKVKSPHSYLVDMGHGNVRHIHANKMRKFIARVQGCGIIADCDVEFGQVLSPCTDTNTDNTLGDRLNDVNFDHLDQQQRKELTDLLNEFAVCFEDKPGFCGIVSHRIVTTPDFVPKQMRPYRIPEILKAEVDKQVKELLEMKLIQPSTSPMASPIVCVLKKQGGVRLAVDYRYLNSFTVGDAFPMPTVNDCLFKIGAAKFISTFDAKSGYWQLPVAEEDRWLTAFVTNDGLYEWVRMPFGLKNAGATFVRAMRMMLSPIKDCAEAYVDDMGVGSTSWTGHLSDVRRFLTIIRDVGMTLNLNKCDFAKSEVKFVGHFVGSGKRRADPQRLEGICKMERPHNKTELRKILGAMGFYREYIPQFAHIAKPLTDLTAKHSPNVLPWRDEHQVAFELLRDRLCSAHVLRIPYIGKPFCLHTDASGYAVGATLGQLNDNGVEEPLAYASQKLTDTQSNWATIEREAYAIIWALNRFKNIIYGSHITVFCDHNPLKYIRDCAPKSARLLRWALALQEFDVEVKYTKGSTNVVADYLSRHL